MARAVPNIRDKRTAAEAAQARVPPTDVAIAPPPGRRKDWALHVMGVGVVLAICYFAEEILIVILLSALIAFILAPVADLMTRIGLPRSIAAAIAVVLLLALLIGVAYAGFNQAATLADDLPKYTATLRGDLTALIRKIQKLEVLNVGGKTAGSPQPATNWADLLTRGFGSVTQLAMAASFIPFLVFFMLTWQEHARAATVCLFPPENQRPAYVTIGLISVMVRNFIIGNFLIGLLIGALSTLLFGLLHVPYFYFVGFVSGFLSLVPYLGIVLALLPPFFVSIGQSEIADLVWIALTVVTLHVLSMNVLYPKFLGGRLRLNPLALTIALLVWASLWGGMGLVLAIPITAGMKIIFDHVDALRPIGAWLGAEPVDGEHRQD